jgi:hypothetical protein
MPCLFHPTARPFAAPSAAPALTAPERPLRTQRISHDIKIRSHIAERGNKKSRRERFIF